MEEYITGAEISARNKRAEVYHIHVARERTRRKIVRLQLVALAAILLWTASLGVAVWIM